jgi:hypothetical protein
MSYDAFRNYDQWKTASPYDDQPESEPDRLVCSECGDEFYFGTPAFEGHKENEPHCVDADDGTVYGRLEWAYPDYEDDGPDPDEAYDRMREGDY